MKNKLSWGIALLPFVPSVWMQGQEQKQEKQKQEESK